jgi:flagellar export protein FliJ
MPPAFVFQNVLDIRHTKVESIEIQLGKVENKLKLLIEKRNALMQQKIDQLNEMTAKMQGEIILQELALLQVSIKRLDDQIKHVENEILETQKKMLQIRASLVEAKQDEETLEILKDKEIEKYKAEIKRVEGIQQDDIYISLAFQKNQQEA